MLLPRRLHFNLQRYHKARRTSLYSIQVPTLEPFYPTATPPPTLISPLQPAATIDLSSLFPTVAAPPPIAPSAGPTPIPALTDNNTINFLLIGHDQGSPTSFRTDTLVAVILWPKDGQVSMISIPRDLWVYIPTVGMDRINTAYEYGVGNYPGGGAALLRDTIAYNLGIRIDHMAMVDFSGFSKIVDTLGGIDVPVACPYTDWRLIDPSYRSERSQQLGRIYRSIRNDPYERRSRFMVCTFTRSLQRL